MRGEMEILKVRKRGKRNRPDIEKLSQTSNNLKAKNAKSIYFDLAFFINSSIRKL
jgi:hypothetical protein